MPKMGCFQLTWWRRTGLHACGIPTRLKGAVSPLIHITREAAMNTQYSRYLSAQRACHTEVVNKLSQACRQGRDITPLH